MRRVFLFVCFFALWSMVCLSMNHRGVNTSHCLFENHRTFGIFKKKNPRSLYLYLFQSTWEVSSTSEHWVCLCECGADSLPTLQYSVVKEFPMWWQMLWNSKMGLFFFKPTRLHPSQFASFSHFFCLFPPSSTTSSFSFSLYSISMKWGRMASCQSEQQRHYCHCELSAVAVCRAGPLLFPCQCVVRIRCESFYRFVEGEIKNGIQLIWHHYFHDVTPLTPRRVGRVKQVSNVHKNQ